MIKLQVYLNMKLVHSEEWERKIELGRADEVETEFQKVNANGQWRLPIAASNDMEMSVRHALLEPTDAGLRLTNLSERRSITLESEDGGARDKIGIGDSRDLPLPTLIRLGSSLTLIRVSEADEVTVRALVGAGMADGAVVDPAIVLALHSVANLLRLAMTSEDFFAPVAQAVVDVIGLDRCLVLFRNGEVWETKAEATSNPPPKGMPGPPSIRVLKRIVEDRVTFWGNWGNLDSASYTITNVGAIVVAPILDQAGKVTGAIYTDRRHEAEKHDTQKVAEIEARLVEVIAQAVTVGLQRAEKDKAIFAERARFEQFFTPELSRTLPMRPEMLAAKDAEISVLFCDIRGFSRICERLRSPPKVLEWINDVLEDLSECVRRHKGVLVDYIGDELMAMWGAPEEQPNHACLASRAALDMLRCLPVLNDRWGQTLGEPMNLGIGVNSGPASVGNIGSKQKFKYGPLGNTVNLASRVQGATKYLKTSLVVTGATSAGLGDLFAPRKLCSVRVVNIAEPVVLHELTANEDPPWPHLKQEYETAYELFLKCEFEAAAATLGRLLKDHRNDGPSRVFLSRAVHWMNAEPEEVEKFDAVWNLPGK